jgi:hypothetical protein
MVFVGAREMNTASAQDKRACNTERTTDTGYHFIDQFSSKPWLQYLVILLVATLISLPCLFNGLPHGHDSSIHALYQRDFSHQFWNGDLYPRWLADANKGYGSPIFLIQYPFPYYVTALLRPLIDFPATDTREIRELGVLVFIILVSAGISMRFWLTKFSIPLAATLASIVYMLLPYFLVCVYVRSAIGELCTLIWMPFILGLCETIHRKVSSILMLGIALSLLVTSNILIATMFMPFLVAYVAFADSANQLSFLKRIHPLLLAAILAVGISGVYLLPFIAYLQYFDLRGLVSNLPDFEFGRYFLYVPLHGIHIIPVVIGLSTAVCLALFSGYHLWFYRNKGPIRAIMICTLLLGTLSMIPGLGPALINMSGFSVSSFESLSFFSARMLLALYATLSVGLVAYCYISEGKGRRAKLLLAATCIAFFLMLPFSAPLWSANMLPLDSIQFPFRFGGLMTLTVVGLLALALDSNFSKSANVRSMKSFFIITIVSIVAIGGGIVTWRIDWRMLSAEPWQIYPAKQLDVMYRTYILPQHLYSFAQNLGTRPDLYDAEVTPDDGVLRAELISGEGNISLERESSRSLLISTDCQGRVRLRIGQTYFPLWRVSSMTDGAEEIAIGVSPAGLIELSFQSIGKQDLRMFIDYGNVERWGTIITVTSLLLTCVFFIALYLWNRIILFKKQE